MSTLTRYSSREFIQNVFLCLEAFRTTDRIGEFFEPRTGFLAARPRCP